MPDLPLDTLFIVGLLVASFVGKIIEAKAKKTKLDTPNQSKPQKVDRKSTLPVPNKKEWDDLYSETFGEKVEENDQDNLSSAYSAEEKIVLTNSSTLKNRKALSSSLDAKDFEQTIQITTQKWLKTDALSSSKALKRAFIVKEVIDQPVGLRKNFF
ncbi:MAG: hypothetical protein EBY48_02280 [Opitutae bacterium]|jgi:hypothetical protein|nr:hypothetical protein [Opitutae bacterium]